MVGMEKPVRLAFQVSGEEKEEELASREEGWGGSEPRSGMLGCRMVLWAVSRSSVNLSRALLSKCQPIHDSVALK